MLAGARGGSTGEPGLAVEVLQPGVVRNVLRQADPVIRGPSAKIVTVPCDYSALQKRVKTPRHADM